MNRSLLGTVCFVHLVSLGWSVADEAEVTLRSEFKDYLIPVVERIRQRYIDEISPDTLMHAGVRGLFQALDPASDYVFNGSDEGWNANFSTFQKISHALLDSAFYAVGPDTLVRLGISGMMSILDPHTFLLEKFALDHFTITTRGKYGGLGFRIQVVRPDSAIAVWSLLHDDTPAARAGVKSGDLIIAIDDSATAHMSAADAAGLMRGLEDTPVTLTLTRAGVDAPLEITIVREEVQIHSVPAYGILQDSTGYIKLTTFQHGSTGEVRRAIEELQGTGVNGLIFDLRGNGGGFLQEAIDIADLLLPVERLVVFTAGRAFKDTTEYPTKEEQLFEGPLIILVDGGSASGSEIVAGAVQDWDRGLILGMPTVGKGSVQQTYPIGDKAELKLTIAAYFIPSGRSIDRRMRKDSTLVTPPDKEFRTLVLNRIVRGAGGITPDISMEGRRRTPLYDQLSGRRSLDSKFFRFSRQYHLEHPGIDDQFVADKKALKEFRRFLEEEEFEYVSSLEARLTQLEEMLVEEEEDQRVRRPMGRLKGEIEEIEEKHWKKSAELVRWKLTFDILEKNLGIEAAYAYETTVDPQILRAAEILSDPLEYESWFRRKEIGVPDDQLVVTGEVDSTGGDGQ